MVSYGERARKLTDALEGEFYARTTPPEKFSHRLKKKKKALNINKKELLSHRRHNQTDK